jgi:hypothetical protein
MQLGVGHPAANLSIGRICPEEETQMLKVIIAGVLLVLAA